MELISIRIKNTYFLFVFSLFFSFISCGQNKSIDVSENNSQKIVTGAEQTSIYFPIIRDKRVGIVANQTSLVYKNDTAVHIVDELLENQIQLLKIFSPEHGFRGKEDASAFIEDGKDSKTGLPILSLHGKTRKPLPKDLNDIDVLIFDIQDLGVRFYTYISTLHYVMEACAENDVELIVLDRPNPNGHYVDGPVLEAAHKSFLGMHEVPLVYGMTIGEYAKMINGEKWLKNNVSCELAIIPLKNYTHESSYSLPVRPSPNIPNDQAVNLYPSLGLFEGTTINAGRGTEFQFQRYGAPFFPKSTFSYVPASNFGAKYPKHKGELCYGVDLGDIEKLSAVDLQWIIDAFNKTPKSESFFGATFTAHAGNSKLEDQIRSGLAAEAIRATWQKDIAHFKETREKYLLYD